MRRVVITGLGAVTPLGNTVPEFWNNLLNGVSGAGIITHFNPEGFKTCFAHEVKDFDPLDFFDQKEARKLDRYSHYGIVAANQALSDSGLTGKDIPEELRGVIVASGIGGFETFENEIVGMKSLEEVPRPGPFFITKIIANGLAGEISIRNGFRGINYAPVSACASSSQALIHAFNNIRLAKADCVLAGGSEAPITRFSIAGFNAIRALSTNNEEHLTACRPFDRNRDGFVLGEGAAMILVECLESALSRGAKIYAEIIGCGERADAYHITGSHPEGLGAKLAMSESIREAGIDPEQIDYVNVHATSTILGDPPEIMALASVFANRKRKLQLSATKSMTGHMLGAAGSVEAIATVLSISENKIPPTINTQDVDIDLPVWMDLTLGKQMDMEVNYALSNSFGFGGHCASIIFKKYTP
jgi:3-oxoacyl-[acyl-carrier-protein] synthase II